MKTLGWLSLRFDTLSRPQVRWFKDGSEIRKGKKYEIISKGAQRILIIHKSVFDDEAEYECDARTSKSSGMLTVIGEQNSILCFCVGRINGQILILTFVYQRSQRRLPGSPRTFPMWRVWRQTA